MLETLDRGWTGFLLAYLLAWGGLSIGARLVGAELRRLLLPFAVVAVPTLVGALILWTILREADAHVFEILPTLVTMLLGIMVLVAASVLVGALFARVRPHVTVHRGARVMADIARSPRRGSDDSLTFAGCPLPHNDETKHFKLIGSTGTGKSTAIRELLAGALSRGDRAVIADPDASYLKAFHTAARGDVILNPFDPLAARWDLFAEVVLAQDADQLARSLIPDYEGSDRNWRNYARTFLTAVLRQLHLVGEHDLTKLYYLLVLAPPAELRELLEATPAGPFLGEDNGKFFESVRSVANVHLAALEHLARQENGPMQSVRAWIRGGRGVLFLPYRASEIAALRQLISTWMRLAIFEAMNAEEGDQRLWFAIDEIDALGPIDGLKDALARLRKFGGRCAIGLQSIAQMRGTYGDTEAQTIVENCGNTLILRCSASERGGTAEFASRLIGQREIIRRQVSRTKGGPGLLPSHRSKTTGEQHSVEYAVLPSEIEQLPDLEGFLKIASRPEWRRVQLSRDS